MDSDADRRQMEVVEQHRQMVVQAPARVKVELQCPGRGQAQHVARCLLAEPELQIQREFRPFDRFLQMSAVDCGAGKKKKKKKGKIRWNRVKNVEYLGQLHSFIPTTTTTMTDEKDGNFHSLARANAHTHNSDGKEMEN